MWLGLHAVLTHVWCTCGAGLQSTRPFACRSGLDRPPPKTVNIEYDPEDVDTFIAVADAIEGTFPSIVVEGNQQAEGRPGSFEVLTSDGIHIFSRLKSSKAPKPEDIVTRILNRTDLPSKKADEPAGPSAFECG